MAPVRGHLVLRLGRIHLCCTPNRAAHSVRSPPQPNPGLPGFGRFKICRKRASPQPAGEGLGVGVVVVGRAARLTTTPTRLASLATLPTRGRVGPSSPLEPIPLHLDTRSVMPGAAKRRARNDG